MKPVRPDLSGRRQAGFTLLEMMVAVGVLTLVLVMAFEAMKSTTDMSSMESARNAMERTGAETLALMHARLKEASIVAIPADGSIMTFQMPVDLDGNGTVLDADGNCEFGIEDMGGISNGTMSVQFVQNTIGGNPEVLSETTMNRDLNNDGDTNDVFDRGRLELSVSTGLMPVQVISGRWIVQPSGNWGGDINSDGNPNPLFRQVGKQVFADMWMITTDQSGMKHMVRCQTSLHLRN